MLSQIFLTMSLGFFLGQILDLNVVHISYFQEQCFAQLPDSRFQDLQAALLCGRKPEISSAKLVLLKSGLIHILVVSGAHLFFLRHWLKRIPYVKNNLSVYTLLAFYVFVSGCQVPSIRAISFMAIRDSANFLRLNNLPAQNTFLSICFSFALDHNSFFSYSIYLSWLACLAIQSSNNHFIKSIVCYIFLLPILYQWQVPSPWTIVINSLVTPVIGHILFPLNFASLLITELTEIVDCIWDILINTLQPLPLNIFYNGSAQKLPTLLFLILGTSLNSYFGIQQRRARWQPLPS